MPHTMAYSQIIQACFLTLFFEHSIQLDTLILPSHSFKIQIVIK
jgi:hypothetical protein